MNEIVTRAQWGAEHGRGPEKPGPKPLVVIHHSFRPALDPDTPPEEERSAVRGIEHYHVHTNGWAAIGYNFLVAPSGRIYEGRGWGRKGAHAGPVNGTSAGICLLIDGDKTEPTTASIAAVRALIGLGGMKGHIASPYAVTGHRDHMARDCPGDRVYARLQEFRHDAVLPTPLVDLVGDEPHLLFYDPPDRVEPEER